MDGKITITHGYITGSLYNSYLTRDFTIAGTNSPWSMTEVTVYFRFWAVCGWNGYRASVVITNLKDGVGQIRWLSPSYKYIDESTINQWDGFVYTKNVTSQWNTGTCNAYYTNVPPMRSVYKNTSATFYILNSSQPTNITGLFVCLFVFFFVCWVEFNVVCRYIYSLFVLL